ncbi:HdeD family acid-resistance protein [Roseovarius sp. 2305UL8-3]|uniref:HdeD family acid-resistance protein n=1 Tax=Roseovarius conchicola TaxID=3121636 RepID=UPI003527FA37
MISSEEKILQRVHRNWGWITALGVVLLVFGTFILTSPLQLFVASLTIEVLISMGLAIAGILQIVIGWGAGKAGDGWWQFLGGFVYFLGGVFLLFHPTAALVSLLVVVALVLLADGFATAMFSMRLKNKKSRVWGIISAACSILIGVLLLSGLPGTAAWALGFLVGVAFVFEGIGFVVLGLEARTFETPGTH